MNNICVRHYSANYGTSEVVFNDMESARQRALEIVERSICPLGKKIGGKVLADLSSLATVQEGLDLYNKRNPHYDTILIQTVPTRA